MSKSANKPRNNNGHTLYYIYPTPSIPAEHYNLCSASSHNRLLPADVNFITRSLYKNCY